MSNYPTSIDDDSTLPSVYDNITEIGAEAINALKDAVINIEEELGTSLSGSVSSLSSRLNQSLEPDGTIKTSAILSLGLVTLPITNSQISDTAQISEYKLSLDYPTSDLYNLIQNAQIAADNSQNWINLNGTKISSHISGSSFNHNLADIRVSASTLDYLKNKYNVNRNNTNAYTLINDVNNELVTHQKLDGLTASTSVIETVGGSNYPDNYSHIASSIYINSSGFVSIPQIVQDLQSLVEFIDNTSLLLYGSRIQNFYSNGVSRASRSSRLTSDNEGQELVPFTTVKTYLRNDGTSSSPIDDIDAGDDIIQFTPAQTVLDTNVFDAQFSLVNVGDIVIVNYGTVESSFIIKEKKYKQSGGIKQFVVRINGTNLMYSTTATAKIVKKSYHTNKQHVLALGQAINDFSDMPSLTCVHPRSASVLGIGFNPNLIDSSHYNLYLQIYPTGDPTESSFILPAIDITGNFGTTPGKYTLKSIIESTNKAFRSVAKNYRFVAYEYNGEFGIALSDPYNNTSFSIISGIVDVNGAYDQTATQSAYPKNVIDLFDYTDPLAQNQKAKDALGFGPSAANVASPPYLNTFDSAEQAIIPTKIYCPLKRNFYYVNGSEKETFEHEKNQLIDSYGDGYWNALVVNKITFPDPNGRVETTYRVLLDLTSTSLKIGKTLVIQAPNDDGYFIDSGRFIISYISSSSCNCDGYSAYTDITVYDAVHGQETSPQTTLNIGTTVKLYFNFDTISFNSQTATDYTSLYVYKRYFEVYVNQDGKTFSHERARMLINGLDGSVNGQTLYGSTSLANFDLVYVSPKLTGYKYGTLNKINLRILSYDSTSGIITGHLSNFDGTSYNSIGPVTTGFIGQVLRFYDESNIDYVELILDIDSGVTSFSNQRIDIQLFKSLEDDQEVFLLGSCQLNDSTKEINNLNDLREFGNVSEQNFTKSAIDFVGLGERYLHSNGIVSGFDLSSNTPNPANNQIYLAGGIASVNGKFILMNPDTVEIPLLRELDVPNSLLYRILWAVCINDKNEYITIPITDIESSGVFTPGSRKVTAYDVVNLTQYSIESTTFAKLVNRKDLLPLYLVNCAITGSSSPFTATLTLSDVRKYAYSTDSSLIKYSSDKEFGNFRVVGAALNWAKYNSSNVTYISLKGANELVDFDLDLNTGKTLVIDGENNCTLTFIDNKINVSNVTFKNLTITMLSSTINPIVLGQNCRLENVTINGTYTSAISSDGYFMSLNTGTTLDTVSLNLSYSSSRLSTNKAIMIVGNSVKIDKLTAVDSFTASLDANPYLIYADSKSSIDITNSSLLGANRSLIYLNNCSKVNIDNVSFSSLLTGTLITGYNTALISNYQVGGTLYIRSTTSINDIKVTNCSFSSSIEHRLNFITNVVDQNLSDIRLRDFEISQCHFTDNFSSVFQHASIGVVFDTAATTSTNTVYLENYKILNNTCNRDQQFIISAKKHSDNKMYLRLCPIGMTIAGNICGFIGYFLSESKKTEIPYTANTNNRHSSNLVIKNNNCHMMGNTDGYGAVFNISKLVTGTTTNMTTRPTASTLIEGNVVSYIHAGISHNTASSLKIINNDMPACDQSVMTLNGYPVDETISYSIFVDALKHTSSGTDPKSDENSACIIDGNTIYKGYWYTAGGSITTYTPFGYIYSKSSCTITNNICKDTGGIPDFGVRVAAGDCVITNNRVSNDTTGGEYFGFSNTESTPWDGSLSKGIVSNNFMDNYSLSGGKDNFVKDNFPNTWVVEKNINQVGYEFISLTDGSVQYLNDGYSSQDNVSIAAANTGLVAKMNDDASTTIPTAFGMSLKTVLYGGIAQRNYSWSFNLNNRLPTNVKIMSVKLNMNKSSTVVETTPAASFRLAIGRMNSTFSTQEDLIDMSGTLLSTTADASVETSSLLFDAIGSSAFNAASSVANIPLNVDLSSLTELLVTRDRSPIIVSFRAYFYPSGILFLLFVSPILIKYRW
ncbi:MAG: hypothetical protein LC122_13145 [Chitinophagales bacterium]|nr:hypothetical protein [Chitinophagales bacterium]